MKKIFLMLASVIGLTVAVIFIESCDSRKLEIDRVPVPFRFQINQSDSNGLVNKTKDFSMNLIIDESFNGDKAKRKFHLKIVSINGKNGDLLINNGAYIDNMEIPQGTSAVKYTPTNAGTNQFIFQVTNEVNEMHSDTAYFKIAAYTPVPYSITTTPKDFRNDGKPRPGQQKDFDLKVISSDLTGSMIYTLDYKTNGSASIYLNSTSPFMAPAEINPSDNNLKLNIPATHAEGTFWLALNVTDANGDKKTDTLKYTVQYNVKPVISTGGSSAYSFTSSATNGQTGAGEGGQFVTGMCWWTGMNYGYPNPYSPCYDGYGSPYTTVSTLYKANFSILINGVKSSDTDGTIKGWKITQGSNTLTGTISTPSFNITIPNQLAYYTTFVKNSTGGCTGPTYKHMLVNGAENIYTSTCVKDFKIKDFTYDPNQSVGIQVQDNEGAWSDVVYVTLPDKTWFSNTANYPTGLPSPY